MSTEQNLPKDYRPFQELEICSNRLINVEHFIGIDNFSPLLIGNDSTKPLIWLFTRINKQSWIPLVSKNKSNHTKVFVTEQENSITIIIDGKTIINAVKESDQKCIVNQLDMRPVGFNFYGNENGLNIGNSQFNGNTFQGMKYVIGINEESEANKR